MTTPTMPLLVPCQNANCSAFIPPSRGARARYCSRRCKDAVKARNYRARLRGEPCWSPLAPRRCERAGCEQVIGVERRQRGARYCSAGCARMARSRPTADRRCARPGCDRLITGERAQRRARYCSPKCARSARGERSRSHTRRTRALSRERRDARRDRALAQRLDALSRDGTARVRELEAGTSALAHRYAVLEEIAVGHEASAQMLARVVLSLSTTYGDPVLTDPSVADVVHHYLPELGGPTPDHRIGER